MNLLILTQKVDRDDDMLGFFHEWIVAFAKRYKAVVVVSLEEGEHELPENVAVYSLGKEERTFFKRPKYIWNFYSLVWRLRRQYDAVFIHMNPEYAVLGGFLWRFFGKKVALWYNHKKGSPLARIGALFANYIFYTSPYAFMARYKKARQMPAGIDTVSETPASRESRKTDILSLGRISPVKRIDVIVEALKQLDEKGVLFTAHIYGDPTDRDMLYYQDVRNRARTLEKKGKLLFHKAVFHRETPAVFAAHSIFVNATPSGSLDKTILEAAYHGALPIVSNESFRGFLPDALLFKEGDSADLAAKIEQALSFGEKQRTAVGQTLRVNVHKEHNLTRLIDEISKVSTRRQRS